MSQAGPINSLGGISPPTIPTNFTTDSGSATPVANNINILGSGQTSTSASGNTILIDTPEETYVTDSGTATSTGGLINLIGAGGAATSGSGNTIVINASGAGGGATVFPTDSGTAVEVAGVLNINGSGSTTTLGSGNSVTVELTGLTNHAVLVGAGTTTITKVGPSSTTGQVLQNNAGADPAYSIATYPSSTTINQILYSSAANVVSGLVDANQGVLTTGITGVPAITPIAVNGQLIIGSTAGSPAAATLTQGSGISITNGANSITIAVSGATVGQTITGDAGGALSPTLGNWNIIGGTVVAGTSPVATSGSGSTLTVNVQRSQALASADATKIGLANFNSAQFTVDANGFVSTSSTGVPNTITGNSGGALSPTAGNWNIVGTGSITTAGAVSTLTAQLTGMTNHAVLVGAGTATLTKLSVGSDGQVLIGATAADPAFATLTSSDSSISFTTGANSLSLQVAGGTSVIKTITGNSGGAESPSAGNFNILGTGSITVAGSANTETVQLTGLTNHNLQIGAGTATLTQLPPSATAGIPLVSAGSSADPAYSTAVVAGGGTGNTTFTAYSVITAGTTATGAFQNVSGLGSSGQVLTSNGAGTLPTWQPASGGTSFTWSVVTGASQAMAVNNGYIANNAGTIAFTLPTTSAVGDIIEVTGMNNATGWSIGYTTNQQIFFGASSATVTSGTLASTKTRDSVRMVCIVANLTWNVLTSIGNITVT